MHSDAEASQNVPLEMRSAKADSTFGSLLRHAPSGEQAKNLQPLNVGSREGQDSANSSAASAFVATVGGSSRLLPEHDGAAAAHIIHTVPSDLEDSLSQAELFDSFRPEDIAGLVSATLQQCPSIEAPDSPFEPTLLLKPDRDCIVTDGVLGREYQADAKREASSQPPEQKVASGEIVLHGHGTPEISQEIPSREGSMRANARAQQTCTAFGTPQSRRGSAAAGHPQHSACSISQLQVCQTANLNKKDSQRCMAEWGQM